MKKIQILFVLLCFFFSNQSTHAAYHTEQPIFIAIGNAIVNQAEEALLLVSHDGRKWEVIKNLPHLPTDARFYRGSCSKNNNNRVCVVMGDNGSQMILYASVDNGKTWQAVDDPASGFPAFDSTFTSISCTQGSANAFCTVVGWADSFTNPSDEANIYTSINGGKTWHVPVFPKPIHGSFVNIHCTNGGEKATCLAMGDTAFIYLSKNGGQTWKISMMDNSSQLRGVMLWSGSCSGNSNKDICIIGGQKLYGDIPKLFMSIDDGETWKKVNTEKEFPEGGFERASCTRVNENKLCAAGGGSSVWIDRSYPQIISSLDNGQSWYKSLIENNTKKGNILGLTCISEDKQSSCIAVGGNNTVGGLNKSSQAILLTSVDGARTWKKPHIDQEELLDLDHAIFWGVNCKHDGSQLICVAAGHTTHQALVPDAPLLLVSMDGGKDWFAPKINDLPKHARLYQISGIDA